MISVKLQINNMSYFDLLPFEIVTQILILVECKLIKIVYSILTHKTIPLSVILKFRRLQYPRPEGKSIVHCLQKEIDCIEDLDLIKGDIIKFNCEKFIFDGEKLLNLPQKYNEDYLPSDFHVIEDNVPINYWTGVINNVIVWFDHTLVSEQCINHITYTPNEYGIFQMKTYFNYNGMEYTIYFNVPDYNRYIFKDCGMFINKKDEIECIEKFKDMLKSDEQLIFRTRAYWQANPSNTNNELYYW